MAKANPIKNSLIFFSLAIVIVALFLLVLKPWTENKKEKELEQGKLYPKLESVNILELKIQNENGLFRFERDAENRNQWIFQFQETAPHAQAGRYELNTAALDGVINTVVAAKEQSEESLPSENPDAFGINSQSMRLDIRTDVSDFGNKTLVFGADAPVGYMSFAKWENEPRIFTVSRSLTLAMKKKLIDFREKKVIRVDPNQVSEFRLKHRGIPDLDPLDLTATKRADGLFIENFVKFRVSPESATKILQSFADLEITQFVDDQVQAKKKYAFERPLLEFEFQGKDSPKELWRVVKSKDQYLLAESTTKGGVFEIPATFFGKLKIPKEDLRDKRLVTAAANEVLGFDVTDRKSVVSFKRDSADASWKVEGISTPQTLRQDQVSNLLQTLVNMSLLRFDSKAAAHQTRLTQFTRSVVFHGVKDGSPTVLGSLTFGAKAADGEVYVKAADMDLPGLVKFSVEDQLPMSFVNLFEEASESPPAATPAEAAPQNPESEKKKSVNE